MIRCNEIAYLNYVSSRGSRWGHHLQTCYLSRRSLAAGQPIDRQRPVELESPLAARSDRLELDLVWLEAPSAGCRCSAVHLSAQEDLELVSNALRASSCGQCPALPSSATRASGRTWFQRPIASSTGPGLRLAWVEGQRAS
jgi:hypothetical protein